ncbi:MAG: M28 family peptidase [Verrucomicrobiales bacterium]|nr:M28 family peptidase [Verrucomicrobiales bacterium]
MPIPTKHRSGAAAIILGRQPIPLKKRLLSFFILVFLLILLPLIIFFFMVAQPSSARSQPSTISINPADLEAHVRKLSIDFFPRNPYQIEKIDLTADYILEQFKQTGGRVQEQPFSTSTTVNPDAEFRNISVFFGPDNGPRLIIGAHYDAYGNLPGADDNASGVAGLIELAKLFASHPPTTSVELVSYPLEEPPFYATSEMGSAYHVRALKKAGVEVKLMICLEMIGYFTDQPNSQSYPNLALNLFYPSTGNFIAIASTFDYRKETLTLKNAMRGTTTLAVESINAPKSLPGIDFSDHRNYWAYGYPAVMITDTAFYRNPHYHKKTDTADTLNYKKMSQVIIALFEATQKL